MEDNSLVLLGKRIRDLRRKHGFSQERLAELCEISSRHLSEIERGASNPSYLVLARIAQALREPLAGVLDFEHEREPDALREDILSMTRRLKGDELRRAYRVLRVLSE
ncbi:helix-turn-helix domain-containing protein [Desulfovibrio sp. ZJ369]|uniref:helix-turn-helix domain-containing protein n=1 Tax=Desulfovibrio sp. ZJ369 TaxID=2709793 RepID=UPI0013EC4612|nr:helix-turn-helix domain-containing protein [Desulfovibrio sp. ZJ369]